MANLTLRNSKANIEAEIGTISDTTGYTFKTTPLNTIEMDENLIELETDVSNRVSKSSPSTITFTDNASQNNFTGLTIDHNMSGSTTFTGNRAHKSIFIDIDSSATGGTTANEHQIYGIDKNISVTGDSDLVIGDNTYLSLNQGNNAISAVYGTKVSIDLSGDNFTDVYGTQVVVSKKGTNADIGINIYGAMNNVVLEAGTAQSTNVIGTLSRITNNYNATPASSLTALFYGDFDGTITDLSNANTYGLYIPDNVKNYVGGNLTVGGDLLVTGDINRINVTDLYVSDRKILLNSEYTDAPVDANDAGIEVERGTGTNTSIYWDESADRWVFQDISGTSGAAKAYNMFRPGSDTSITITSDGAGSTALKTSDTLTVAGGNVITTSHSAGTITVKHDDVSSNLTGTTTSAPSFGGTFTAISGITVNAQGHVTAATTKTVTIPSLPTLDNYVSWTLSGDTGSQTIGSGNNAKFLGGNSITTAASATDTLTIDLDDTIYITDIKVPDTTGTTVASDLTINGGKNIDSTRNHGAGQIVITDAYATGGSSSIAGGRTRVGINGGSGALIQASGADPNTTPKGGAAYIAAGAGINSSGSTSRTNAEILLDGGRADGAESGSVTITSSSASGVTNQGGADVIVNCGQGTGTQFGGDFKVYSSYSGSSGSTTNPLELVFAANASGGIVVNRGGISLNAVGSADANIYSGRGDLTLNAGKLRVFGGQAAGSSANGQASTIYGEDAVGTDRTGGDIVFRTGRGTGTAVGSKYQFNTVIPSGSSSSSLQAFSVAMELGHGQLKFPGFGGGLAILNGGSRASSATLGGHTPTLTSHINLIDYLENGNPGALIISHDNTTAEDADTELLYIDKDFFEWKGSKIWHAGNDGSGSTLDADTVDGVHASSLLRSDTADTKTSGALIFNDNVNANFGSGSDIEIFCNGSNFYTDINNGMNWYLRDGNSSNATRFTFDIDTGDLTLATGALIESSDERLKTDIKRIDNALDKVSELAGYTFMKEGSNVRQTGVIAQEVEKVLPEAVSEGEDGYKGVAYANMVGLLIEAINELRAEVNDIKSKI